MDYLYSLYDALVSINVPSDKARAVIDAMERDMGTIIATKTDLLLLEQKMDARFVALGKDLELLCTSMTARLGSMLFVGFGLFFAALKLV